MAVICSCDVIDTQAIKTYLAENGPVLTDKDSKKARATLHRNVRQNRVENNQPEKKLCASCVLRLLLEIMKESRVMYPEAHKEAA